jgi:hypothetical protein
MISQHQPGDNEKNHNKTELVYQLTKQIFNELPLENKCTTHQPTLAARKKWYPI